MSLIYHTSEMQQTVWEHCAQWRVNSIGTSAWENAPTSTGRTSKKSYPSYWGIVTANFRFGTSLSTAHHQTDQRRTADARALSRRHRLLINSSSSETPARGTNDWRERLCIVRGQSVGLVIERSPVQISPTELACASCSRAGKAVTKGIDRCWSKGSHPCTLQQQTSTFCAIPLSTTTQAAVSLPFFTTAQHRVSG